MQAQLVQVARWKLRCRHFAPHGQSRLPMNSTIASLGEANKSMAPGTGHHHAGREHQPDRPVLPQITSDDCVEGAGYAIDGGSIARRSSLLKQVAISPSTRLRCKMAMPTLGLVSSTMTR